MIGLRHSISEKIAHSIPFIVYLCRAGIDIVVTSLPRIRFTGAEGARMKGGGTVVRRTVTMRNFIMPRAYRAFLASLALLGAPAFAAIAAAQEIAAPQSLYEVGEGDVLQINVYGTDVYDALVQVSADGTIPVGELGEVMVGGLSATQVGERLALEFRRRGILRDPVVNVVVQEYKSKRVSVLGNVARPGEYVLDRAGMRLTDLLARSGANLAQGASVIRITNAKGEMVEIPASDVVSGERDRVAQPYETIVVTEAPTFYILGEVQNPGAYPLEPGLTMERAMALAGGLTPRGSRNKLKVTRKAPNGVEISGKVDRDAEIRPNDLIRVGARIF
ncbi:SLBB domain-containing protein [uncultured Croceicoccus sp.]|uniref:SLBB domain-containing protein n=1 Tax=uncultured Croceicoccus sp. TaxID=1295329 RepID=UPI00262B1545|nr:SLBB domain-containing protein [uncultured Croceicoccus sp.]